MQRKKILFFNSLLGQVYGSVWSRYWSYVGKALDIKYKHYCLAVIYVGRTNITLPTIGIWIWRLWEQTYYCLLHTMYCHHDRKDENKDNNALLSQASGYEGCENRHYCHLDMKDVNTGITQLLFYLRCLAELHSGSVLGVWSRSTRVRCLTWVRCLTLALFCT
jgi:hypothetical protein